MSGSGSKQSDAPTVQYAKFPVGGTNRQICELTLDRPRVHNAYSVRMRDELYDALGAIEADDEVACLVLRGAGPSFCAGADLTEFGTAPSVIAARRIRFGRDVWRRLDALRCPTVAALHGNVIGSGFEMAMLCDVRVAAVDARFALPDVGLGMLPVASGTYRLIDAAGLSLTTDLVLTGRTARAAELFERRLLTAVVPAEELVTAAHDLAQRLARIPPGVALAVKSAVRSRVAGRQPRSRREEPAQL